MIQTGRLKFCVRACVCFSAWEVKIQQLQPSLIVPEVKKMYELASSVADEHVMHPTAVKPVCKSFIEVASVRLCLGVCVCVWAYISHVLVTFSHYGDE